MQAHANSELFDAVCLQKKKVKVLTLANQEKDAIIASLEDEKAKNAGKLPSALFSIHGFLKRCFFVLET